MIEKFRPLHWKEIEAIAGQLDHLLKGKRLTRIWIPERPQFKAGFLRGEWIWDFEAQDGSVSLLWSLRPQRPWLAWKQQDRPHIQPSHIGLKSSEVATHSPFELFLKKNLVRSICRGVTAKKGERLIQFQFDGDLEVAGFMIPAQPEAFLLRNSTEPPRILGRSRGKHEPSWESEEAFELPFGKNAPPDLPIRPECATGLQLWDAYTRDMENAGLQSRWVETRRVLNPRIALLETRIRDSSIALNKAVAEPNHQLFGDLLKSVLYNPPPIQNGARRIFDYSADHEVDIPADAQLSPAAELEKFYSRARRKIKRIEEATIRLTESESQLPNLKRLLDLPMTESSVQEIETALHIASDAPKSHSKKGKSWTGKTFLSQDGIPIWVGGSREENMELVFKIARGNDLWLHVRGKPGAHVIVPLRTQKNAPLETLLDAAHLVIVFSGGEKWGKTEVDYTLKKHLRRIPKQTEVTYSQNKTLLIELEPKRLARLLGRREI